MPPSNQMLAAPADFTKHAKEFLKQNPDIETVELLIGDLNGIMRGKWAPPQTLTKVSKPGVNLPLSVFGFDIWGREVDETGLNIDSGDKDGFCVAIPERISRASWNKRPSAQVLMTMLDEKRKPFFGDPRNVLQGVVNRLTKKGLTPVTAIELEFYIVEPEAFVETGKIASGMEATFPDPQYMYSLDALGEKNGLFSDIQTACDEQGLPADTIIKEAAPGQFEINLNHRGDAMAAADDAVMLRRAIVECAKKHGLTATFMAKPFMQWPGNGLHVHASLLDRQGVNVFSKPDGETKLQYAVNGLLETMEDALLFFVPGYNGYRRLQPGSYAPTQIAWGKNNRSVAVRIPASGKNARRVEHRLSGADANPYLVMAAVLGGMLKGLNDKTLPPRPVRGNAYEGKYKRLSDSMSDAISTFEQSPFIANIAGKPFRKIFSEVKKKEFETFRNEVTPLERKTYL